MAFRNNYGNMVVDRPQAYTRLIREYDNLHNRDFDFIIIGSGIGGGILADDLADRVGHAHRILLLDVGSFIYPTHVYNISRIPNFRVAAHFGADSFTRREDAYHYIGASPQLAFGGRSIFWSGLIPQAQPWELEFFPSPVREDLMHGLLAEAGRNMNESASLGAKAKAMVEHFQSTSLNDDFEIIETPRAVHQPYLNADGTPRDKFFVEPTGVFNTAELLINQLGLTHAQADLNGKGLFVRLNSFVEGVYDLPFGWHEVKTTHTLSGEQISFYAPKVIIAGGSIESPKLINRSSAFHKFADGVRSKVGFGLTDHPVSAESQAYVEGLGAIDITRDDHAKILFYSRGHKNAQGHVIFPFNIEMNINHEFWHLRNNDPLSKTLEDDTARSRVDIKFSFANCLDDQNGIFSHATDGYTPEVSFKRFALLGELLQSRFPAVAGWHKSEEEFFSLLNGTRDRVFAEFKGLSWLTGRYGAGSDEQWPFGWGTVHHACGTLRMPWKQTRFTPAFDDNSVVDENLEVRNTPGLYVCDMSVMPISTAANPVRTLAALSLRLSRHLA